MKNIQFFKRRPLACLFPPVWNMHIGRTYAQCTHMNTFISQDNGTCHPPLLYRYYHDGYRRGTAVCVHLYLNRCISCTGPGRTVTSPINRKPYRQTSLHTRMHALVCSPKRFFNRFEYPTYTSNKNTYMCLYAGNNDGGKPVYGSEKTIAKSAVISDLYYIIMHNLYSVITICAIVVFYNILYRYSCSSV